MAGSQVAVADPRSRTIAVLTSCGETLCGKMDNLRLGTFCGWDILRSGRIAVGHFAVWTYCSWTFCGLDTLRSDILRSGHIAVGHIAALTFLG